MKVKYRASLTADEQDELVAWIDANGASVVDLVIVEEAAVAVYDAPHGPNHGRTGLAVRHGRPLTDALDEALANLQD